MIYNKVLFFQVSMVFTLNNSQQDDNDEEEERYIKDHSIKLVFISSRILDLVSNAATSSYTHVHVEQVAL